jgi:hypothetical protein
MPVGGVGIIRSIVIMPVEGKLGAMIRASHHAAHGPAARPSLRCRADEGMPRVIMPVDVVVTDLVQRS